MLARPWASAPRRGQGWGGRAGAQVYSALFDIYYFGNEPHAAAVVAFLLVKVASQAMLLPQLSRGYANLCAVLAIKRSTIAWAPIFEKLAHELVRMPPAPPVSPFPPPLGRLLQRSDVRAHCTGQS